MSDLNLPVGVTIGTHTYGYEAGTFQIFMEHARIEVGAFCSIAPEVRILAGSEHITSRATTFPLNALLFEPGGGNSKDAIDSGVTRIGNDVWLGLRAIVLSGVQVGDGAVVGAGSVVTKAVDPYSVVAGNPARVIRYRFEEDVRRRLLALRWWEWEEDRLLELRPWLMSDVRSFLDRAEQEQDPRSPGRLRGWLRSQKSARG